jgi:hypothetical protein
LKDSFGAERNKPEIIEMVYELQAGDYVKNVNHNESGFVGYCEKLQNI